MKNFTKKISMLVALVLCITIGGVYAQWYYAENATVTEDVNKAVTLAPVTQAGSIGTYEVGYTDFSLVIDQTAPGDYTPELDIIAAPEKAGDLTIKFIPEIIASEDAKTNGIETTVTFSSNLQHEGTDIFTFSTGFAVHKANCTEAGCYKWVALNDGSGAFLVTIPMADLSTHIMLNYTVPLDTYAKYQAFGESLKNGVVNIVVSNTASLPHGA